MTRQTVNAIGGSMGLTVPSGSVLTVRRLYPALIRPGDIICFIDDAGRAVAHRVMSVRGVGEKALFEVRGDAQDYVEQVPAHAVVYRVDEIRHRLFHYPVDGPVGRFISASALLPVPLLPVLNRAASSVLRRLRRRS